ncbi:MAG: AMP nucleosidase [Bernardetiaceae bacterium]
MAQFRFPKQSAKAKEKKAEIVRDWLTRYTGTPLEEFGEYILLTNFYDYLEIFARNYGGEIRGREKPMQTVTADNITFINFGIGSPQAATVMDLISAVSPKSALFLGKCGGLKKKTQIGDFILPIAAIRGEGTSDDYMPPEVPALPSFRLQKAVSSIVAQNGHDYWTGTVYTTNRRVWEHDTNFKRYLRRTRAMGIDMETATIFTVGFINEIPHGALLLVSDMPMIPEGVKTSKSDKSVTQAFAEPHVQMGYQALKEVEMSGESMKHLRF